MMIQQLSLNAFLAMANAAKRIAIYREINAHDITPIHIAESLANEMQDGAMLESGLDHQERGRYSFIAFGSIAELCVRNKVLTQRIGSTITTHNTHPFTLLRQLISQLACVGESHALNYVNSAVGFVAFDAIRLFESIPDRHASDNSLPDLLFNFYQNTLVFDHQTQKLLINIAVDVDSYASPQQCYEDTQEKITAIITKIQHRPKHSMVKSTPVQKQDTPVTVDISDEQFIQMVTRAKQHIVQGDAFQIVLSRRFTTPYTTTPFEIYRALHQVTPAPYMFYLPLEDGFIIGASPEKLISVQDRQVETHPIAGTRQCSEKSSREAITKELLSDTKEIAEHMMLVDLSRNDLGAVCKPGSVKVSDLLTVKHFSHISHITSVVSGELREDKDSLDALAAAFPAGTLSGAPKIRAMEIIDELETSRRGLYGGAICRIDHKGNLDSCIAIRMAVLKDNIATVRTGAGIVFDSDPQSEANETRQKAKGILEAIKYAEAEKGLV